MKGKETMGKCMRCGAPVEGPSGICWLCKSDPKTGLLSKNYIPHHEEKHIAVQESPEDFFGINAGKVWGALKTRGSLSIDDLCALTNLGERAIFGALGWLGKEKKITIVNDSGRLFFDLVENEKLHA